VPVPAPVQLERLHTYGARGLDSDPLTTTFWLLGDLDPDRLRDALVAAAARHDALRTRYATRVPLRDLTGGPADLDTVAVDVTDPGEAVSVVVEDADRADVEAAVAAFGAEPFDLANGVRVRALLLRVDREEWLLSLVVDHLVADRIAQDLLLAEVGATYAGRDPSLLPPAPSYLGYAQAQWDLLAGSVGARRLAYWADWFARTGVLPTADLRAGASEAAGDATSVQRVLPPEVTARIAERAREQRTTSFNVVAAGLLRGLAARQERDVTGLITSVSNRTEAASRALVGLVAVALPLWVERDPVEDFAGLVRRTTRAMATTMSNGVALLAAYDEYLRSAPAGAPDRVSAMNQPSVELYFDGALGRGGGGDAGFGGLAVRPYTGGKQLELSAGGSCFLGVVTPTVAALGVLYADVEYGRAAVGVLDDAVAAVSAWALPGDVPAP
jgi:hypothetical protein